VNERDRIDPAKVEGSVLTDEAWTAQYRPIDPPSTSTRPARSMTYPTTDAVTREVIEKLTRVPNEAVVRAARDLGVAIGLWSEPDPQAAVDIRCPTCAGQMFKRCEGGNYTEFRYLYTDARTQTLEDDDHERMDSTGWECVGCGRKVDEAEADIGLFDALRDAVDTFEARA